MEGVLECQDNGAGANKRDALGGTRQRCRLSICEYWLSFTDSDSESEAKIQVTLLILRLQGVLSIEDHPLL